MEATAFVKAHYSGGGWDYAPARELTVDRVIEDLLGGEVEAYEFFVTRGDLAYKLGCSLPREVWDRVLEYPSVVVKCYEEEDGVECSFEYWLMEGEYDSVENLEESDARELIGKLIGLARKWELVEELAKGRTKAKPEVEEREFDAGISPAEVVSDLVSGRVGRYYVALTSDELEQLGFREAGTEAVLEVRYDRDFDDFRVEARPLEWRGWVLGASEVKFMKRDKVEELLRDVAKILKQGRTSVYA